MLLERWRHVSSRPIVVMLVVGFAYFAASKFALPLVAGHSAAALIWPAAGIAVAAMLVLGWRVLPGLWLAYFAVNLLLMAQGYHRAAISTSIVASASLATGLAFGGALGTALVRELAGKNFLRKGQGMLRFLILAGPLSGAIAAIIGSAMLCAGHVATWSQFPELALTWWTGNCAGVIAVAPLLLTWCEYSRASARASKWIEITALGVCIGACLIATFVIFPSGSAGHFPTAIFLVPGLAWAGARFGLRGATAALSVVISVAMFAGIYQTGSIAAADGFEAVLLLQLSLGSAAATMLVLTAIAADRQTEIRALRTVKQALEIRMRARDAEFESTHSKLREQIAGHAAAERAREASQKIDLAILSNYTTQMMALNSREVVSKTPAYRAPHVLKEPLS